MTSRVVHRPARTVGPDPAEGSRPVEPPPTLPDGKSGPSPVMGLLPMAGIMGSLVMMTMLRTGGFVMIGVIVLVVAIIGGVVLLLMLRGQAGRTRLVQRERYLEYLERLRTELREHERDGRERAWLLHPPPAALYDVVRDPARLWERRRGDSDFLLLRAGTGELPARQLELREQGSVLTPSDPFMLAEARSLMRRFSAVPQLPLTVPLDQVGNVSVVGDREDVLRAARALLLQLATFHAPEDVTLALACPPGRASDWAWMKWLPHLLDRDRPPALWTAGSLPELSQLLADDLADRAAYTAEVRRGLGRGDARAMRRLVVISDGHGAVATDLPLPGEAAGGGPGQLGVTVVHLVSERVQEPSSVAVRLRADDQQLTVEDLRGGDDQPERVGRIDEADAGVCEGLARMLAPLRLSADSIEADVAVARPDLPGMLGIDDVAAIDLDKQWRPRGDREFLRVPIGVDDAGRPLWLDLKEAAQLGMGPHGLCVGATGSGKSELLRTLVLALAATHVPEQLAMILLDYKGGATFAPFADLPHVAGVITNLEDDAALIERAYTSLSGEVQRRQRVLKEAGNVANIADYAALRQVRPELDALPHLFVIIDEFGELLSARPDFIELFLSIGRIGRSIGVHLLLSSQRIEQGKLRGLETYLSYRIGLRTFSEEESRTVLESVDAFHLPALPGFAYLKVDTSVYTRFKAAYVSAPWRGDLPVAEEPGEEAPGAQPYELIVPRRDDVPEAAPEVMPERSVGTTLLDVIAGQLTSDAAVGQIWLPPLPDAITLDGLPEPPAGRELSVPLGLLDDPARQWQDTWRVDLTASGGHLAVIGGPQSGKTTLLRTLVLSLSRTATPQQVAVYGIDLTGGSLLGLAGLPHVGGVATRNDRERIRRTVEEIRTMLSTREQVFSARGIDSPARLRDLHGSGQVPELEAADVVLVVDGFGGVRGDFEELEEPIADLLQRGGGYGIHVVAAMLRWNDVKISLQSTFGTQVELRLGDPSESLIGRKLAETIAAGAQGRVLTGEKLFAQTALPRVDGIAEPATSADAMEEAVASIAKDWTGPRAPAVRLLPLQLTADRLPGAAAEPSRIPVGLDEATLSPVLLDLFKADQHLLIFGDSECGKTNLLSLIAQGVAARYTPDQQITFAVFDPRRGLQDGLSRVHPDYVGGYAATGPNFNALATGMRQQLLDRMPKDETGPVTPPTDRIVVFIDDYDLITTSGPEPLSPLIPFVPAGRDIGLHIVLARRASGAARGLFEPLVMAIRESGATALVMDGDRGEGQLFPGVYPESQPPGRGRWIRRGRSPILVQTALAP